MKFKSKNHIEAEQFTKEMADRARREGGRPSLHSSYGRLDGGGPFGLSIHARLDGDYASIAISDSSDEEGYTFARVGDWIIKVGPSDFRAMPDARFRATYEPV